MIIINFISSHCPDSLRSFRQTEPSVEQFLLSLNLLRTFREKVLKSLRNIDQLKNTVNYCHIIVSTGKTSKYRYICCWKASRPMITTCNRKKFRQNLIVVITLFIKMEPNSVHSISKGWSSRDETRSSKKHVPLFASGVLFLLKVTMNFWICIRH